MQALVNKDFIGPMQPPPTLLEETALLTCGSSLVNEMTEPLQFCEFL